MELDPLNGAKEITWSSKTVFIYHAPIIEPQSTTNSVRVSLFILTLTITKVTWCTNRCDSMLRFRVQKLVEFYDVPEIAAEMHLLTLNCLQLIVVELFIYLYVMRTSYIAQSICYLNRSQMPISRN